ncbi:MAG: hypothetical protein ACMUHX_07425 [bacterium]
MNERSEILGGFLVDNGSELRLNQQIQIIPPFFNNYYISHLNPSVENIGNIVLVVWESWRDEYGFNTDIYGRRIPAGKLDSELIQISAKEAQERYPEAGSNGKVFFVMWKDLENIYGRRISKEGILLEDNPPVSDSILIGTSDPNHIENTYNLAVASNGLDENNQFLCVWSANKKISDIPFILDWYIKGYSYSPPPPPVLAWPGSGSYSEDGINPDSGPGGSQFTFKVKYGSSLSLNPDEAQVWIDLDDNGIYDRTEKFDMTVETDGITYTYTKSKILYDGDGMLNYRFFFSDDYNTAVGEPAEDSPFQLNKVSSRPELYWTNEPGFTGDGARPDSSEWSTESTNFEFRVLYKDEDGDPPGNKDLCVDKNMDGVYSQDEHFEMSPLGSNYQAGVIYIYNPLALNSDFTTPMNYKFDFDDGKNKATGEPGKTTYLSFTPIGETAVCLNNYDQFFPSITLTNDGYQAFWEDRRENYEVLSHIWMVPLAKSGRVEDNTDEPGQIRLDTSSMGAFKPKGLFDSVTQKTLVIWEDLRNGTISEQTEENNIFKPQAVYNGLDIYGLYIDSNGNPLTDEFLIAGSGIVQNVLNADLALGLNGQYLVVWEDEKNIGNDKKTNILARFIKYESNPPGAALGQTMGLLTENKDQILPSVASNGAYYLAVWQDIDDADPNSGYYNSRIYGKRIDPNGEVYPQSPFKFFNDNIELKLSDPNINQLFPDVASDGENFLIVWQDSRNLKNKKGYDIYGMRVNINAMAIQYLDSISWEVPVCTADGHQIRPGVVWNPQEECFLISWLELPDDYKLSPSDMLSLSSPAPGNIKFVRMDKDGKLLDSEDLQPVSKSFTQNLFDINCSLNDGCRMIWEDLRNDLSYDIYTTELQKVLRFAGDPNFINGINPLAAFEGNLFTFKIEYLDWKNNALPGVSQVWIDLDDDGSFGEDEKFDMDILSESPMIYTFKKEIDYPENGESDNFISYRFYFEDQNGMVISGLGSNLNYFLLVPEPVNNAVLEWVGTEGFETDGVDPDQAYEGTKFEFSVSYRDPLNNPPIVPHVWIDQDDNGVYDDAEVYGMIEEDPNDVIFSDGKVYSLGINLFYPDQGDGNITYRFFFTYTPPTPAEYKPYFYDIGTIKVKGEPTTDHSVSLKGARLDWEGSPGFESDGADPDQADEGTEFKFSVSYSDQSNNSPTSTQVWIDTNDNGSYEETEKFDMNEKDPSDHNYTNGKVYSIIKALYPEESGEINYRFIFTYDPFDDPNNSYGILVKGEPSIDHKVSVNVRRTIDLKAGWSMISLPFEPSSTISSDVFPSASVIYSFDKESGYNRVKTNEELETGKGYWILLDQDRSFILTVDNVINEYSHPVENEWYMIGACSYGAKASVSEGKIAVIYSFVPGTGYKRVLDTENLEPGKGYWILFKDIPDYEEAVLTVKKDIID